MANLKTYDRIIKESACFMHEKVRFFYTAGSEYFVLFCNVYDCCSYTIASPIKGGVL